MSEMIDRVAKAVGCQDPDRCPESMQAKNEKCETCRSCARDAIAAMRAADHDMALAYWARVDDAGVAHAISPDDALAAMIDAALEES